MHDFEVIREDTPVLIAKKRKMRIRYFSKDLKEEN